jgi:hypothetical protein
MLKPVYPTAHPTKYILSKKLVCYDPSLIFLVVLILWKEKVCAKNRNLLVD